MSCLLPCVAGEGTGKCIFDSEGKPGGTKSGLEGRTGGKAALPRLWGQVASGPGLCVKGSSEKLPGGGRRKFN